MIPRLKAHLGFKEVFAAISFWKKDSVINFENDFAKLSNQKYAISFPYGRTGLFAILKAMRLEGKEVICPGYTCVVVPHAIVSAGCIPVFVDSQNSDFNMDWDCIDQAVNNNTGAIIATSIFGNPINLDALAVFKKNYPNVKIIQDCAHSFMASWENKLVNKTSDAAFFGMNISKLITSIFGGMVTTDSQELQLELLKVKEEIIEKQTFSKSLSRFAYLLSVIVAFWKPIYGFIHKLERSGLLNRFVKYFDEEKIDMPLDFLHPLTPLEARVGKVQCNKYSDIVKHRSALATIYTNQLCKLNYIKLPPSPQGATFSHYVIRTNHSHLIIERMRDQGIQVGELIDYYIPDMKSYSTFKNHDKNIARNWPQNIINLPVHMDCAKKDAIKICEILISLEKEIKQP